MPTKFGLAGIGLRGHLEPKNITFHFGTVIQNGWNEIFVFKI